MKENKKHEKETKCKLNSAAWIGKMWRPALLAQADSDAKGQAETGVSAIIEPHPGLPAPIHSALLTGCRLCRSTGPPLATA